MRKNGRAERRRLGNLVFEDLVFKVADEGERNLALELRKLIYEDELGPTGFDPLDGMSDHLVACERTGEVIGAFRLVGPEHRPFDFETHLDVENYLGEGRSCAMLGRMCIRRDYRPIRRAAFVQMGMLKLAHDVAVKRGITDFFMYTFTHLLKFYRGVFFQPLGISFEHPVWRQVHLMHLDVVALPERCMQSRSSLAKVLFSGEHPNFQI